MSKTKQKTFKIFGASDGSSNHNDPPDGGCGFVFVAVNENNFESAYLVMGGYGIADRFSLGLAEATGLRMGLSASASLCTANGAFGLSRNLFPRSPGKMDYSVSWLVDSKYVEGVYNLKCKVHRHAPLWEQVLSYRNLPWLRVTVGHQRRNSNAIQAIADRIAALMRCRAARLGRTLYQPMVVFPLEKVTAHSGEAYRWPDLLEAVDDVGRPAMSRMTDAAIYSFGRTIVEL